MRGPKSLHESSQHARADGRGIRLPVISLLMIGGWLASLASGTMAQEPAPPSPTPPLHARIDAAIAAEAGPVERCDDADFLRRISLDLVGMIPTADEARAFLDDTAADKREKLVDRLLADPRWPRHMAGTFDVMLMERRAEKHVKTPEWQKFLYDSFVANKPLNELAREILTADGVDPQQRPAARFYLDREGEANLLTRDIGRIFFGRDMQCAQCHDHPLIDDYLQTDYFGLYAFLNRSYMFQEKGSKTRVLAEKAEGEANFVSVFDAASKGAMPPKLPGGSLVAEPALPADQQYAVKPDKDVRPVPKHSRRALLAGEAASGHNEAFNRNFANRLWAQMMGRGLVEPLDLHHSENPPTHPDLLADLAQELVAKKFDVKSFQRELALSATYQRKLEMPADVLARSQALAARVAGVEAEVAKLSAEVAPPEQSLEALDTVRKAAAAEIDPLAQEANKASAAMAAAQKPADEAALALTMVEQQLQLKQQAAAAVAAALAKTNEALAIIKEDADLKLAADKIAARSTQIAAEAATMQQTAAQKAAAAKAAIDALTPLRQAVAKFAGEFQAAKEKLNAIYQQRAEAALALEAKRTAANRAKDQLAALQAAAVIGPLTAAAAASQTAAAQPGAAPELAAKAEADRLALQAATDALAEVWARRFVIGEVKHLSPEQLGWSVMQVAGQLATQRAAVQAELDQKEPLDEAAKQDPARVAARARQIEELVFQRLAGNLGQFVNLFAADGGQPQTEFFATVDQALFLANAAPVQGWLAPSGDNLLARAGKHAEPAAVADELYLGLLTRRPTADEIADVAAYLQARPDQRPAALQELAWALLTSAEFRFSR